MLNTCDWKAFFTFFLCIFRDYLLLAVDGQSILILREMRSEDSQVQCFWRFYYTFSMKLSVGRFIKVWILYYRSYIPGRTFLEWVLFLYTQNSVGLVPLLFLHLNILLEKLWGLTWGPSQKLQPWIPYLSSLCVLLLANI